MKFLCPACERLLDISTFRVEGTVLVLRCARCGEESRSAPAAEAPPAALEATGDSKVVVLRPAVTIVPTAPEESEDPFAVPPDRCPKCVAPRRKEVTSCAACGLVFANFKPEEHRPSAWLTLAWKELLASWEDPATHDRFVKDVQLHEELMGAGRLYRLRLARFPEDAMALHGRDALLNAVSSAATVMRAPAASAQGSTLGRKAMLVLVLLLVLWGTLAILRRAMALTP